MQTIKTAAIVVLLMSVVYGAWVSLTTPPDSLPPDVVDMIVTDQSGEFPMESALPPSLGDLGISAGTPEMAGQPTASTGTTQGSANVGLLASEQIGLPSPHPNLGTGNALAGSVAPVDQGASLRSEPAATGSTPIAQIASADTGFRTTLTDQPTSAAAFGSTPHVAGNLAAGNATTGQATQYQDTGRTFRLPDPGTLDPSSFAGSQQPALADEHVSQVSAISMGAGNPRDASPSGYSDASVGLINAIRTADSQYARDQPKESLSTLSLFYSTPNLSGEQRSELLSRLDPLAAEVIYSGKHLLASPHRVGNGETLVKIAQRYQVPWQLLANINRVRDPVAILPGTELKVVQGPFRAEVDVRVGELTVFLGDLYAGRFPIAIGNDPAPRPGTYTVQDKQTSKVFYDAAGSALPPGSPDNPYGNAWIDLGGNLCIHGSPNATRPTNNGCISVAGDSADDLYGILSHGSTVTIK